MQFAAPKHKTDALDTRLGTEAGVFTADTALVVIDPQVDYCTRGNRDAVEDALDVIESARFHFNRCDLPVFIVYSAKPVGPHGLPRPDAHVNGEARLYRQFLSGNFELCAKWANSAFRVMRGDTAELSDATMLARTLRHDYPNVEHLVLCGVHLGMCVQETAQDAMARGYRVSILADGSENGFDNPPADYDFRLRKAADLLLLKHAGAALTLLPELKAALTPPCAVRGSRPASPNSPTPAG